MRLPSTRELARRYAVSRGIVVSAFEQLQAEGYLEARTGSGTHVNTLFPEEQFQPRPLSIRLPRARRPPLRLSSFGRRLRPPPPAAGEAPTGSSFPRRRTGAGRLSPRTLGAGRVATPAPRPARLVGARRPEGISAAAGGRRRLPGLGAGSAVHD